MNPKIVVEAGDQAGREIEIPPREQSGGLLVGRSQKCHVRFDDRQLSRQHCRFTYEDDRLFVEDLDSKNGTRVNGDYIDGPAELHDGSRVELGNMLLVVRFPLRKATRKGTEQNASAGTVAETSPEPGDTLDQYEIEERLHRGEFCTVYRARDSEGDQTVALKVAKEEDPDRRARFLRGARIAAELDHAGFPSVLSVGESDHKAYAVAEFVDGRNVADVVHQHAGPLTIKQACRLTAQALSSLQHVAGRGMVLRSLQPSNVLLDSEMRVRIVDYNLLRALPAADDGEEITGTHEFGCSGDVRVAPPELVTRPLLADRRCDVFAAGSLLYFLLTGQPPYDQPGPGWYPHHAFRRTIRRVREWNEGVPPPLARVVMRSLSHRLDDRYPRPTAMLNDMKKTLSQLEG